MPKEINKKNEPPQKIEEEEEIKPSSTSSVGYYK